MRSEILGFAQVSYAYDGGPEVVTDLDIKLKSGEKVALLGANGAGKSTILHLLCGLLRPTRGQIHWQNKPIAYDKSSLRNLRSEVCLLLQNPDEQLFAPTVEQDIAFGPLNMGLTETEIRSRVETLLVDFDLAALRHRPLFQLSLGQRKKVALAGALAMQPKLLAMDEPTAGLDPQGEEHLLAALEQRVNAGMALFFSTHDVDLAWHFADHVLILDQGRIAFQGSPETVLIDEFALRSAGLRLPYALKPHSLQPRSSTCPQPSCS